MKTQLNRRDCVDILSVLKAELEKYVPNNTNWSKIYIKRAKELILKIERINTDLEEEQIKKSGGLK